jgi:hypothetical protein
MFCEDYKASVSERSSGKTCNSISRKSLRCAFWISLIDEIQENQRKSGGITIMKLSKSLLGMLAAALALACFLPSAQAQFPIDTPFQIRYASNLSVGNSIVMITNGTASFNTPSLATATQVTDFTGTPVAGTGNTGVFSSITPGTPVTMTAPLDLNQPEQSPSMLFSVGGFTVDVTGTMTMTQTAGFLDVNGTGTLTGPGIDQAPGSFIFTAATPDRGMTVALLGISLTGIVGLRRKFGQAGQA